MKKTILIKVLALLEGSANETNPVVVIVEAY
jgi:hypothetical protein